MTEIKLDANKEVGWHVLPDELRALSCGDYDGKDMPLGLPTALRYLADAIEEQVKPAIDEPQEFGSIIRAGYPSQAPHTAFPLWQRSPIHGKHYWMSEYGDVEVWSELTDVEVLRVGLGEGLDVAPEHTEDYKAGVGDTVYKLHGRLQFMLSEAIGAERKNAIERIIAVVEDLAP